MTVTYLGQKPGGQTARNELGRRSYTRTFLLEASSKNDTAYDVGSNASLPLIGSVHPDDSAAYCRSLSVTNPNPYKGWEVVAEYDDTRQTSTTDPSNDETLVSFDSEIYDQIVSVDIDGNAILNSAGDAFVDPPPTRDAGRLIASVQTNQLTIPGWFLTYQNAVNSTPFTIEGLGVATGYAKAQRFRAGNRQLRNGLTYYPISFEIHMDVLGWKLQPLDQGLRERNADNKLVHILNEGDGNEITSPVPLDGTGKKLNNPTTSNAVFGSFSVQPELDFRVLPGIS